MQRKLSPRDISVIVFVILAVLGGWFLVMALLLRLAIIGDAFYAWLGLLIATTIALRINRNAKHPDQLAKKDSSAETTKTK